LKLIIKKISVFFLVIAVYGNKNLSVENWFIPFQELDLVIDYVYRLYRVNTVLVEGFGLSH